eukprot:CFRG4208T1
MAKRKFMSKPKNNPAVTISPGGDDKGSDETLKKPPMQRLSVEQHNLNDGSNDSLIPTLSGNSDCDEETDDEKNELRLLRRTTTIDRLGETMKEARVVSERAFLVTRLAFTLIRYMGIGWRWILRFAQMLAFILLLLPAFLRILVWLLRSKRVLLNIRYGPNSRNSLDIYQPTAEGVDTLPANKTKNGVPVIVFISGGAWIIGYKCWGALMGKEFSQHGVMFVTPDYRNFPQGRIVDMLEDTNLAMRWIFKNIHLYGGDPNQIFLVGQSAGAHISSLALLTEAERERRHKLLVRAEKNHYVPMNTYTDGANSYTQPLLKDPVDESYVATANFAAALKQAGIHAHVKYYENKSHTDPIIEDPMGGGYDKLVMDIFSIVLSGGDMCTNNPCRRPSNSYSAPVSSHVDQVGIGRKNCIKEKSNTDPVSATVMKGRADVKTQRDVRHQSPPTPCANVDPTEYGFEPTKAMLPEWIIQSARKVNPF